MLAGTVPNEFGVALDDEGALVAHLDIGGVHVAQFGAHRRIALALGTRAAAEGRSSLQG